MIRGIGTDIVEISRIRKSMENPRFLQRAFTKAENEYFKTKKMPPESVAACFAAKEAFLKALGIGFSDIKIKDIEILHNDLGAPYIVLYNKLKELMDGSKVHISLSHSEHYATSVVVIEE